MPPVAPSAHRFTGLSLVRLLAMSRLGQGNDLRVLAMLFCQEIVIDPVSYRRTLVGLFDMITPPTLP